MTHIENEVEAPRDDAFGLAALNAEKRRERLERAYRVSYKVAMALFWLGAAVMIGYHSRIPTEQPFFIEQPAGALMERRSIDYAENCFVVEYVDENGRQRHRNTHCPALTEEGTLGWPLGRE